MDELENKIRWIDEHCPMILHTGASQLFTAVRRMQAEKQLDIPMHCRTGGAISVEDGKRADELDASAWEALFARLCADLQRRYPDLHGRLFPTIGGIIDWRNSEQQAD